MSRSSVCRCVPALLAVLLALPVTAAAATHRGGTFVSLATENAGTADPQVNATSQYWHLYQVTQDGLTAFRKTTGPAANSVVADLATRLPQTSDGGRTWTLTLRRGVRYSNGAPVRPGDVRFTFERLFKVHGPTAESLYGAIDGAEACLQDPATCTLERGVALSGRTITFNLTRPDTEWPQKLALPPVALLPPSVGDDRDRRRTSRASSAPARTTGRPTRRRGSSCCGATRTSRSGRPPRSRTATSTGSCSASGWASRPRSPRSSAARPTGSSTTSRATVCPSC